MPNIQVFYNDLFVIIKKIVSIYISFIIAQNMKHYKSFLIAVCLLTAISCRDENVQPPASEYQTMIYSFLDEIKAKNENHLLLVTEVETAINFRSLRKFDLATTEDLLIAELSRIQKLGQSSNQKAIFFLNSGQIVRAQLVVLEGSGSTRGDEVVQAMLNRKSLGNYSGNVSFYNIFQKIQFSSTYSEGKIQKEGIARKVTSVTQKSGRTQACTDWYYIETFHYAGGQTSTVETYLFTTCDEPCGLAGARVNCGGGGGGGGTSTPYSQFPQNPQNGDVYETTDPEGFYTKYMYDAVRSIWVGVMRVLPAIVLQDNPSAYPFLQNIGWPVSGQSVTAPDGMVYTYNGGSATWVGYLVSQNKLCGSYTFTVTGDGLTAEIITLSASALHRPSGQHIFHLWGSGCVTFGSSTGLTNSEDASQVFNLAWGVTMDEVEAWLNQRQEKPLELEYSNYIKSRLIFNLQKYGDGYAQFSTGPCSGSGIVPTSARYCN
jgi:hypothetical protein